MAVEVIPLDRAEVEFFHRAEKRSVVLRYSLSKISSLSIASERHSDNSDSLFRLLDKHAEALHVLTVMELRTSFV